MFLLYTLLSLMSANICAMDDLKINLGAAVAYFDYLDCTKPEGYHPTDVIVESFFDKNGQAVHENKAFLHVQMRPHLHIVDVELLKDCEVECGSLTADIKRLSINIAPDIKCCLQNTQKPGSPSTLALNLTLKEGADCSINQSNFKELDVHLSKNSNLCMDSVNSEKLYIRSKDALLKSFLAPSFGYKNSKRKSAISCCLDNVNSGSLILALVDAKANLSFNNVSTNTYLESITNTQIITTYPETSWFDDSKLHVTGLTPAVHVIDRQ